MERALAPLVLAWLALHAALLVLIVGAKFFGAKLILMMLLVAGAVWFLLRQPRRLMLPHRHVV